MSIFIRAGKLSAHSTYRWIHTTAYARALAKPEAATHLLNSTKLGRHRSPKLKRDRASITLPDSFLSTNYLKSTALKPLPSKYAPFVSNHTLQELEYSVRSSLSSKGPMSFFNHTDHLKINIPDSGSCYLQDHLVQQVAAKVNANLLILDPQDFVFLAQHSFDRKVATLLPMLSSLDPDANALLALGQQEKDEDDRDVLDGAKAGGTVELLKRESDEDSADKDDYEQEDDEDELDERKIKINTHSKTVEFGLDELLYDSAGADDSKDDYLQKISKSVLNQVSTKYTLMFKRLLAEGKEPKILYLRDYDEMQDAFTRIMLKSLVTGVEELKQKGHHLMIIASQCKKPEMQDLFRSSAIPNMRTISVLPPLQDEDQLAHWMSVMEQDRAQRTKEINAKQLLASYRQKNILDIQTDKQGDLLNALLALDSPSLTQAVWTPKQIDRRVATAIGHALQNNKENVNVDDFVTADEIVKQNQELIEESRKKLEKETNHFVKLDGKKNIDFNHFRKHCDDYEKKLLPSVVDPAKVQGSFKDVRAPPMTIDTLQSVISLPLTHPDLFKKGILKKNFIPGVLLFGPPGTGKTMLAKAVAKDSGSRMLEIKASDVYDMYVGEGEKNVKAIFSLARKLSPCVIFIDEVDSLMSKRGSNISTKTHREIINQFMVEWDGLSSNNQGVIVMAATNRPFDLDDAVLRRMPRRILVDLPNEQDRAEILKMLLADEDHQVSIQELAKQTEHYSGSDLKNVCVTAALRAVQQQVATNIPQVLTTAHFEEALKMVPPSSSEDMESLVEIRKWDSKYGDGQKKKKTTSIGFS